MSATQEPNVEVRTEARDPFFYGYRYGTAVDEQGRVQTVKVPLTQEDVLHPREGDIILQNSAHSRDCVYLKNVVRAWWRDRKDVVILQDTRVDWGVEGIKAHGPDLALFCDAHTESNQLAGTFYPAEVGGRVVLVIEVTSPSTRDTDLTDKVGEYYAAGIPLYVIVDHSEKEGQHKSRVIGYRSMPEGYLWIPPDSQGRLWLEPLGLWIGQEQGVALYDSNGEKQLDHPEVVEALRQSDARMEELQTATEEAIKARKDAEVRATAEARARQEAETLAADLQRRLLELEAQLRPPGQPT